MTQPKIAIVHDWLTNMGGAEPVVLELHKIFPSAPIYTSVYDKARMPLFHDADVRTTYLQKRLPTFLRYKHVLWPVLRAFAFRKLDLSEYDIIISSSSAEAKAVRTRKDATHICYCHTPTRYYWSHYEEFKREFRFGPLTFLVRPFIPLLVRWMRKKDLQAAAGVNVFIANSEVTKQRIKQYYKKTATVVHPPVNTKRFMPPIQTERSGYVLWGRHVPYKRFDLAIEACNKLGAPLTVIGSGPDTPRLKKLAGPTITFTGRVSDEELVRLAHSAKYFFFPNEEDFGIAAVEALAAGCAVIAYKKGGSLDIVQDALNGVFFARQTVDDVIGAMKRIDTLSFSQLAITQSAKRFDTSLFVTKIRKIVSDHAS